MADLFLRPTWAEIDLTRLRSNLDGFRARMPAAVKVLFVVKGDAYGHGAARVSLESEKSKAVDWLGVSSVEEGVFIRGAGARLPILVLGSLYPFRESFSACIRYGLTPTLSSLESAKNFVLAAQARRPQAGRRPDCHLKIETGMGRIGVSAQEAVRVVQFLSGEPGVSLSGVYTHFSCADTDAPFTRLQLSRFREALLSIRGRWKRPFLSHAANSAAALQYPWTRLDMVRPGLALYGLCGPFDPVLSMKSRIVFLKEVPRSTPIGYGAHYRTRRRSKIATIPVGYADGVPRRLGEGGRVLVRGRSLPIVGRIAMDMMMVDVTELAEAHVGDEVVLIGRQGRAEISAADAAEICGTIPYETVVSISKRVPRLYLS
jgi:alanine racemase